MKRELPTYGGDDRSPVVLTADQKIIALKGAKDLIHAASYIHEMVEADALPTDMRNNMCGLLDHYLKELTVPLGYASEAAQRLEERHAEVRSLNGHIRELERQLGEAAPIDLVPNFLSNLRDNISNWWQEAGFGWIHDFSFTPFGSAIGKFSFNFDRIFSGSDTPSADKQAKKDNVIALQKQGYILVLDDRETRLLDCDVNRALLHALLKERFPSIQIRYWENRHVHKSDQFSLWGIQFVIQNIRDLVKPDVGETN